MLRFNPRNKVESEEDEGADNYFLPKECLGKTCIATQT